MKKNRLRTIQESINEAPKTPKKPTQAVRDALVAMNLKADEQVDLYDQLNALLDELDGTFTGGGDGEMFVVYAHSGRNNGSAWVKAKNKADAKKIAKEKWLDLGTVDEVQTLEEYKESEMFDEDDEIPDLKLGEYEEIDWGT